MQSIIKMVHVTEQYGQLNRVKEENVIYAQIIAWNQIAGKRHQSSALDFSSLVVMSSSEYVVFINN